MMSKQVVDGEETEDHGHHPHPSHMTVDQQRLREVSPPADFSAPPPPHTHHPSDHGESTFRPIASDNEHRPLPEDYLGRNTPTRGKEKSLVWNYVRRLVGKDNPLREKYTHVCIHPVADGVCNHFFKLNKVLMFLHSTLFPMVTNLCYRLVQVVKQNLGRHHSPASTWLNGIQRQVKSFSFLQRNL